MAVLVLACAVLAGCAGEDLTKTTSDRTTVPPQPGSGGTGPVPQGEIDEPELTPAKLRQVNACELLRGEAVGQLGTAAQPSGSGPERCSVAVTDPGGKELRVSVSLGESMYTRRDRATGGLDGLPLIETRDEQSCTDKVITSEDPDIGISVQVNYTDGEPCGASRKALSKIIQRLKSDPPKLDAASDSLLVMDPCDVLPKSAVSKALGAGAVTSSYQLHGCTATAPGGKGSVSVTFSFNYPPLGAGNAKDVELSSSVTGIQSFYDPDTEVCKVEWEHKKYSGAGSKDGETVKVDFSRYIGDGKATDACKKAVRLAKSVLAALPGE